MIIMTIFEIRKGSKVNSGFAFGFDMGDKNNFATNGRILMFPNY